MFKKIFIIILFLSFGIIIGYYLKPQINVIIYDQTKSIPKADDFQQMLNSDAGKRAASLSPEIAEDVMRVKSLTPLVKAGPFHLSFNPKTNDFLILQMVDQQPIVEQATEGDEISLLFTAKGLGPFIHFVYDKKSGKLLRSFFSSFGEGGLYGPKKYTYIDSNGDGRFNKILDYTTGDVYEEKEMQWIKMGHMDYIKPEKNGINKDKVK